MNGYTVANDAGRLIERAEIRLISKETTPVINPDGSTAGQRYELFIDRTDAAGRVTFEDVPTGAYTYSINSSGHESVKGEVEIMPSSLPVLISETLTATPITYTWSVTPITIEDRYEIILDISLRIDNLNKPSIVSLPPWATIAQTVEQGYSDRLIFVNQGDLALRNVRVEVVGDTKLINSLSLAGGGDIGTIEAGESVQLSYYIAPGTYENLRGGGKFKLTGTFRALDQKTGEFADFEVTSMVPIYNPAPDRTATIRVPGFADERVNLPELRGGGDQEFDKLPLPPDEGDDKVSVAVKLQIPQEATLEREGFEAVLTFRNGLSDDLVGFSVAPRVFDAANRDVTSAFYIVPPSMSGGLSAADGSQTLAGGTEFTASWILVPGEGLGGEDPAGKKYYVEAAATYSQAGQFREFNTHSEEITVHPQPLLELFYYLPQNILANTPFRLGVFVENNGFGEAKHFRIKSGQPKITENEGGVPLEIEIVGSSFGAGNVETKEWSVEFGDIAPHSWARGYWITRCNLDAIVTDFTAELQHLPFKGVQLNPLITAVHTEIILGDFLFADAIDPNNSFSLIDRDDDGIPDYLINLHTGLRQEIIVPDELQVTQAPTIEAPQMTFNIPATNGFVCMVLNDPLVSINIRNIQRHHLDGSGDIYQLSGNNFWRDGEILYIVDRIGEIVDGQPVGMPVAYVIDYQSALEIRKLEIGTFVFNTLMADGDLRKFASTHWWEDYRDDDGFGVTEYGLGSIAPPTRVPLYNSPLPIIAGDEGGVRIELYNGGLSPESGDIGVYLIDAQGVETLVATSQIEELRSYRTQEVELVFDTTTDGLYTLEVRFLDGRTEGNASRKFRINARPVSDAGMDQTVKLGKPVRFNSSRSYDPDGVIVNYQWYMDDRRLGADGRETGGKWIAGPVPSYTFTDSGTYKVMLVVTDYDGAMEEGKMLVTVEETRPDLYVASFGHGQTEVLDGQSLTISVVIGNAAEDLPPGTGFYVGLYAGDSLVATRFVTNGIASGQTLTITFDYIADIRHDFLTVVLDDMGNLLAEANKYNNVDTLAVFADQTVFPDLVSGNVRLSVSPQEKVDWGRPIQILADIRNIGEVNTDKPFRVTAYMDGTYLTHQAFPSGLATGVTETASFDWVPTPGEHLVEVIADWPYSHVRESNEQNNRAELMVNSGNLTLNLPNIVLQRLDVEPANGELASGVPVLVTASLFNDSTCSLPFGSEIVMTVNGQVVARRSVGALSAGRFSAVQLAWVDPWTGTHTIKVTVDPDRRWYERDTADNVIAEEKRFTVNESDLTIRQLVVPSAGQVGVEALLGINIANNGKGWVSRPFTVKLLAADRLVAVERIDRLLLPGQAFWWSPVWVPDEAFAGSNVTLRAEVDTLNEIAETDETNNTRETSLAIAQGVKVSLSLQSDVTVPGDDIAAFVDVIDTRTMMPVDPSAAVVSVHLLDTNGTEVAAFTATNQGGWTASILTTGRDPGSYRIRAAVRVDSKTYVSPLRPMHLIRELLVECGAPDFVPLGAEMTVTGRVTTVAGDLVAARNVSVRILPDPLYGDDPLFFPTMTDTSGVFSVSLQTDAGLAGELTLSAQAVGADLMGMTFASSNQTTLVSGVMVEVDYPLLSGFTGEDIQFVLSFEAVGTDIVFQSFELVPDAAHPGAGSVGVVLSSAVPAQALTNGQVLTVGADISSTAAVRYLPVEARISFSAAGYSNLTSSAWLVFSAEERRTLSIELKNARIFSGSVLETRIPDFAASSNLTVRGVRQVLIDVLVANHSDQMLENVLLDGPDYPWAVLSPVDIGTLQPGDSAVARLELQTYAPGMSIARFPIDISASAYGGVNTSHSFQLTMQAKGSSEDVDLICLLRDQYGNALAGRQIVLEAVELFDGSDPDDPVSLVTGSTGVGSATLPAGRYQYVVVSAGSSAFSNRAGEMRVEPDIPGNPRCERVVTVTVDPFGLSVQRTVSQDRETLGQAELNVVLEGDASQPLKLYRPGREFALIVSEALPAGYGLLDPYFTASDPEGQFSLSNTSGEPVTGLRLTLIGELADYIHIRNRFVQGDYLHMLFMDKATAVIRWDFNIPALLAAYNASGEDLLLDGAFHFTTMEGHEALYHVRLRISEHFASFNGVAYGYVSYTDWLGRHCPVGLNTLPLWLGQGDEAGMTATENAGLLANISQRILAAGQSFILENAIRNQLSDQSLFVENSTLRILDYGGNDVSGRFRIEVRHDIAGQSIAPLQTLRAGWKVTAVDPDLGGTDFAGIIYTARIEGATRYGVALVPFEQEIEFTVKPAPSIQVSYEFKQTGARSGILTARVSNNGAGPAYNVLLELPLIKDVTVEGNNGSSRSVERINPGDTAVFIWNLSFSRDIQATEVLGQLRSLNPVFAGESGAWTQAPVTHEFRTKHTLEEVAGQLEDLMNALANKIENEYDRLLYLYGETGDIIGEMKDLGQIHQVVDLMNAMAAITFAATDMALKISSLASDLSGYVSGDSLANSLTLLNKAMTLKFADAAKEAAKKWSGSSGDSPDSPYVNALGSIDLTGLIATGDSMVNLSTELVKSLDILHSYAELQADVAKNFHTLYSSIQQNGTVPSLEAIRKHLTYSSVDSREFYRRLAEFMEQTGELPVNKEDYRRLRAFSVEDTVNGVDMYLEVTRHLGRIIRAQLISLDQSKVSAIFPVDLLYQELRSMTAALVTYDVGHSGITGYQPKVVKTPPMDDADDTQEVFWYAMGTSSPYWQTPVISEAEFGRVKELLLRSMRHLQMQWVNISFHAEILAEYSELSMTKFVFDSYAMVSGQTDGPIGAVFGAHIGVLNSAIQKNLNEEMAFYKEAINSMIVAEKIGLKILFRDIQDYTTAHLNEAGSIWSFLRDFSGHLDYLIAHRPIDPVLSVEVLSFEIDDAILPEERGMALTPGVISLANNGTLDWSGAPKIKIYSDGRKILDLELPTIFVAAGKEGVLSFGIPLPDTQNYSLFGFDFELTLELWEEETLSRASFGPWVTTAQSGVKERLALLGSDTSSHLFQQTAGADNLWTDSYTATRDGALRFMLLHAPAAFMRLRVYDEAGNMAGYSYAETNMVVEIADAAFIGADTRCQLVMIRNVQAGSVWTVEVDGVSVNAYDQFAVLANELPEAPARLYTRYEGYTVRSKGREIFIQADLIEVGGTHGVTDLELFANDPADAEGNLLSTDVLVFALKDGGTSVAAGERETLGISITLADDAVDGRYTMELTVAGTDFVTSNRVEYTFNVSVDVDTTPPSVPTLQIDVLTNGNGRVVLHGISDPGTTVELSNSNGVQIASAETGTNGVYTTSELELIYGDYEITAVAVDAAGNDSAPSDPVFYQSRTDWLAPVTAYAIEGTRLSSGAYLNTVKISLMATDDASGVDQTLISYDGGGTWTNYEGVITFDAPGNYSLDYYSVDLDGNREQTKSIFLSVTNQSDLTAFEAWAQQIPAVNQRGANDSPMGDGIPNLAKYAVGLSPTEAHASSDLFVSRVEGNYLILRYRKSKQALDAFIIPECSTSLLPPLWRRTGIELHQLAAEETDDYEAWEARLPLTAPKAFMRLRFSSDSADATMTFSEWVESIPDPAQRGAEDSPMGDGIPNLMKYAAGLNPMESCATADLFRMSLEKEEETSRVVMLYYKNPLAFNVYLDPVTATTLTGDWTVDGIKNEFTGQTDEYQREMWKASIPVQQKTQFLRLQAVTASPE